MIKELQAQGFFSPLTVHRTCLVKLPRGIIAGMIYLLRWMSAKVSGEESKLLNKSNEQTCSQQNKKNASTGRNKNRNLYPADIVYPYMYEQKLASGASCGSDLNAKTGQSDLRSTNLSASETPIYSMPVQVRQRIFKTWTNEDKGHLARALAKHPGGARGRWKAIARTMNAKTGRDEDSKYYIKQARRIQAAKSNGTENKCKVPKPMPLTNKDMPSNDKKNNNIYPEKNNIAQLNNQWTEQQQKQLEKAIMSERSIKDPKKRWQSIGSKVHGKTSRECLQRYVYFFILDILFAEDRNLSLIFHHLGASLKK